MMGATMAVETAKEAVSLTEQLVAEAERAHQAYENNIKTFGQQLIQNIKNTGMYDIDEHGSLCVIKFDKEGFPSLVQLCNFVARISAETVSDNGVETKISFDIEGILYNGRPLPNISVPSGRFSAMSWVVENWGVQAIVRPGMSTKDQIRAAIQTFSSDAKREHIYTHLGWRQINGVWVYLHAGGAIGSDVVKVDLSRNGLNRYKLPDSTGDVMKATNSTLNLLEIADKSVTYSLLAMVGLSPLCEVLRQAGFEPSFILWLLGESGTRKSSIAALFLNHFGAFQNGKELPAGFKDTANALEKKAFATKDSLLVVDDFHPKATVQELRQMEQVAQQLLRGYGDHQGRGRMTPDGDLRPTYVPRGCCIVTGEDVPKAGISTAARYLTVPVDRGGIDLDKLSAAQLNIELLNRSGRGYLEWLSTRIEDLSREIGDAYVGARTQAMRDSQHGRLPETVAHLYLGLMVFTDYAVDSGAMTKEDQETLLQDAFRTFLQLADEHAKNMVEDTPVSMFLTAISELLFTEKVHFRPTFDLSREGEGELIGYEDDTHYYLIPETAVNAVTQFYAKQNRVFPSTKSALLKQLESDGLIMTTKTDKQTVRTPRKKIGGKAVALVWLSKNAIPQKGIF